jgi:23S rRNA (adenine2503-C2)-methyltransferase
MQNLKDLTLPQLEDFVLSLGEQRFRAKQIFKWMYQKRLPDFSEMTNMPKTLRASLSDRASIAKLPQVRALESAAGDAVKFAFALNDHDSDAESGRDESRLYAVESVLLIDGERRTACLSSQLGCGLGCAFCETAKLGFIRNLSPSEILGQLIGMNDYQTARGDRIVTNIVFMGMGEALSNYENFISALSIIMHEDAFNLGARRITVSTAGVVPHIEKLIGEGLSIGLAISLNAWNDEMRGGLMPINKRYPIAALIDVAKRYYNRTGRRVTFEYVLIEGKTDTAEAADALSRLLGGFPCKVNLIPVNPVDPKMSPPGDGAVQRFADELYGRGLAATVRKSRGRDVFGACGQLTAELMGSKGR